MILSTSSLSYDLKRPSYPENHGKNSKLQFVRDESHILKKLVKRLPQIGFQNGTGQSPNPLLWLETSENRDFAIFLSFMG